MADLVFAGNPYLAEYAAGHNPHVAIVPTVIDTDAYVPIPARSTDSRLCIGWSGSFSTIPHFDLAVPVLRKLKDRYGDRLTFKVIGDARYRSEDLGIEGLPWRLEDEIRELSSFDIGIMPLPDDPWARGKCGLKGLQYMALGIPTVMSPVGVNEDIIQDGVNGFLAGSEAEWLDKLSQLIESAALRKRLGTAARQTVEAHYSVEAIRPQVLRHFSALVEPASNKV